MCVCVCVGGGGWERGGRKKCFFIAISNQFTEVIFLFYINLYFAGEVVEK